MIRLPGLIDPHVHLRDPGETYKEDFDSGTAAALAGGFVAVLAMPNTRPPLTDGPSMSLAREAARVKARCDYGIYLGAATDNVDGVARWAGQACGLKLYLDQTFGPLRLENLATIWSHLQAWPKGRPVAVHAEGRSLAVALLLAAVVERAIHVCHVSRREEILLIRAARERGLRVSCEVAPHHLLFTAEDFGHLPEGRREVRPPLNRPEDRQALWDNLAAIDCFATDHAPHTAAEKDGPHPPPGFPGLETALGLLWTAVTSGRLAADDLVRRMHRNPARIFGVSAPRDTYLELDTQSPWEVRAEGLRSRCGWTPYEGMRLPARIRRVVVRGQVAYEDGVVYAPPGSGRDVARGARSG